MQARHKERPPSFSNPSLGLSGCAERGRHQLTRAHAGVWDREPQVDGREVLQLLDGRTPDVLQHLDIVVPMRDLCLCIRLGPSGGDLQVGFRGGLCAALNLPTPRMSFAFQDQGT